MILRALMFCVLMFCVPLGCSQSLQTQAAAADAVAVAANAVLPALVADYQAEGKAAIAAASTRPEAEAALATVRARWRPVWQAVEALAQAQDVWASAIEAGRATTKDAAAVTGAWCTLRRAIPAGIVASKLPVLHCEASSEKAP